MPRTVTLTITDDEVAVLASAAEHAQRTPAAWNAGLASLLGKLDRRIARTAPTTKPTSALLAEHEPELDAELARRRSSGSSAHGGSL